MEGAERIGDAIPKAFRSTNLSGEPKTLPSLVSALVPGAGIFSGGREPVRARALLIPSPTALTRSPATVAGSCIGISRAGVGSHGGMLRS